MSGVPNGGRFTPLPSAPESPLLTHTGQHTGCMLVIVVYATLSFLPAEWYAYDHGLCCVEQQGKQTKWFLLPATQVHDMLCMLLSNGDVYASECMLIVKCLALHLLHPKVSVHVYGITGRSTTQRHTHENTSLLPPLPLPPYWYSRHNTPVTLLLTLLSSLTHPHTCHEWSQVTVPLYSASSVGWTLGLTAAATPFS